MKKRFLFTALIIIGLVMIIPAEYVLGDLYCVDGSKICSGTDLKTCFCEAGECAYMTTSCLPGTCINKACVTCDCTGRTCGTNSCGEGSCGTCTSGKICYNYNCCTPVCGANSCGQSDGCGGECTNCPDGYWCNTATNKCECGGAGDPCDGNGDSPQCCSGYECSGKVGFMTCKAVTPTCNPACGTGYICQSGSCVLECTPNYETRCYDGDIYWYDKCGNIGSVKEPCPNTCRLVNNVPTCVNIACSDNGVSCEANNECCSSICDIEKILEDEEIIGQCVAGSTGGSSECPISWKISGSSFSASACYPAGEGCEENLDWDSWRKENGIKVETSYGEPNTFTGVCLSIKGYTYNKEANTYREDTCNPSKTGVIKWAIDGCSWCTDRDTYVEYPCEFGCYDGACRTSNICSAEAGTCNINSDCCTGMYCTTEKHCCEPGEFYDTALKTCNTRNPCYHYLSQYTPTVCPFGPINDQRYQSGWWGDTDCVPTSFGNRACCNVGSQMGFTDWYDTSMLITTY